MSVETDRIVASRRSIWNRIRFQLGGGLFIAVLLPWWLRNQFGGGDLVGLNDSFLGSALALIAGYYWFRRVSRYPGARKAYYVLPTFGISYLIALTAFFFLRLDYSRLHFLASFALCVCWFYFVYLQSRSREVLRLAVVPFGEVDQLHEIDSVEWVTLNPTNRSIEPCDAIVADLRAEIPSDWERYLTEQAIAGTLVMHVKQIQESLTGRVSIEHLSENNLGSLMPGILYPKVKRVGDLALALLLLPPMLLLFLIVAIAIKLDSPGPVFFKQERMGHRGTPFIAYKFRSMVDRSNDVPQTRDDVMTTDDDHRTTRVGRFLRRYRIDELPQMINVVRGEMSWIGPRPEAVPLSLWYEGDLPFYRYRHIVRPGITGWAQVNQGHVTDMDEVLWKLHYDFYYVKNFSMWLDLLIVARTIHTILTGNGAR